MYISISIEGEKDGGEEKCIERDRGRERVCE